MKRFDSINFNLFAALSFFSFGTAMMDYFLVYPSRAIVGAEQFVEYHALLEKAIIPVSVLPFFLITVLNIIMFWKRPQGIPQSLVLGSAICLVLDWISSIFIQIPMNLELNHGKDPILIQQVMDTNWGRVFLESLQVIFVFIMMMKSGKQTE